MRCIGTSENKRLVGASYGRQCLHSLKGEGGMKKKEAADRQMHSRRTPSKCCIIEPSSSLRLLLPLSVKSKTVKRALS